ncbi:O-methyltransferase [Saccharopolyspora erythraea NRRL 2338]|uniref:O-methyltransferase-like protein n=2 Tax=Saccharopolyspora erythraea TaxID=1836 RepID=A4FP65_SACEN|nr:class I SAM-dependent methyltransferase [Saccharopolyspora erythraea]EQD84788.1 tetracenomycin polyketide synthesis O-methyltransferase tcmP [Saccharopolyspora erythraea D]PFG99482.1 O-methyltransferase [Saccharopolyspora erythraea NRRL 2338]QRK89386.1 class I SAM-dependent methyltransferase [Saccharopolyspora erythraea]CAM05840.1 O-methyltransferase-like protein [Saccharopolyspora erythraea NRRL 2338]
MTEEIRLTGAQETLLGTLYAKGLDAARSDPVLGDTTATDVMDRVRYDFRRLKMSSGDRMSVVLRAKHLDDWVRDYLAAHPDATVLHLGCGLDGRAFRLALPPGVRWFDVDQPDVAELRQRLYPSPDDYDLIGSSVTDTGWLERVPADRTTLVVAEGLTMYLQPSDVLNLLRRIVDRFPGGEMMFDAVLPWTVRAAKYSGLLRATGASFGWGIADPRDLERQVPGLRLVVEQSLLELPEVERMPARDRLTARIMNTTPLLSNALRLLRYEY